MHSIFTLITFPYLRTMKKLLITGASGFVGSRVEGIRDLPFFELLRQDARFNS